MKVYSFRLRPLRAVAVVCAVALLAVGAGALFGGGIEAVPVFGLFKKGIDGETPEQRENYLRSLGWEVEEAALSGEAVIIPSEFDEFYSAYNEMQKKQGFDLEKHRGKTVTKYRYLVSNYPAEADVIATLLVYNGKIIGGDLSSAEADGFLTGLSENTPG